MFYKLCDLIYGIFSLDVELWQEGINDEVDSLRSNKTWH